MPTNTDKITQSPQKNVGLPVKAEYVSHLSRQNSFVRLHYKDGTEEKYYKTHKLGDGITGTAYEFKTEAGEKKCVVKLINAYKNSQRDAAYEAKNAEAILGMGIHIKSTAQFEYVVIPFVTGVMFGFMQFHNASHFLKICIALLDIVNRFHTVLHKAHGDINLWNVMIEDNKSLENSPTITLIDFGSTYDIKSHANADVAKNFDICKTANIIQRQLPAVSLSPEIKKQLNYAFENMQHIIHTKVPSAEQTKNLFIKIDILNMWLEAKHPGDEVCKTLRNIDESSQQQFLQEMCQLVMQKSSTTPPVLEKIADQINDASTQKKFLFALNEMFFVNRSKEPNYHHYFLFRTGFSKKEDTDASLALKNFLLSGEHSIAKLDNLMKHNRALRAGSLGKITARLAFCMRSCDEKLMRMNNR